ncbi:hypothetical protein [Bradyrhizobium sp. I71]|uniref:hypothetical protein n=1 Tax=Bradyrhizobium sp. I71 TaxID=2590772 RepID=UPI001EF77E8A|nr:hypothetical protein [Bradyrhizobium sp. I71]ULK98880.1 hypothetical protein FJV43_03805 [Bradyrhizobium sp. I71]
MSAPTPFHEAYPAPWRIEGNEILDRDGCNVSTFEGDDAEELVFWQGIVDAVNSHARIESALRLARAM